MVAQHVQLLTFRLLPTAVRIFHQLMIAERNSISRPASLRRAEQVTSFQLVGTCIATLVEEYLRRLRQRELDTGVSEKQTSDPECVLPGFAL
jgi:hypothetical protein